MDNTCPHCKTTPCLPLWRKLMLGPAASARCRVCGYKVGVEPLRAFTAMLPLMGLVVAISAGLLRDPVAAVLLLFLFLVLGTALYAWWVPLAPREITDPQLVASAKARIAAERGAKGAGV